MIFLNYVSKFLLFFIINALAYSNANALTGLSIYSKNGVVYIYSKSKVDLKNISVLSSDGTKRNITDAKNVFFSQDGTLIEIRKSKSKPQAVSLTVKDTESSMSVGF